MIGVATGLYRMLVRCPGCERPIALSPGPMLYATENGEAAFDKGILEAALRIHLRTGCDGT